MSGSDQLSPAEAYAAAKARAKHSVTQEFIDSFDFGFDEFQIQARSIGGSPDRCRKNCGG